MRLISEALSRHAVGFVSVASFLPLTIWPQIASAQDLNLQERVERFTPDFTPSPTSAAEPEPEFVIKKVPVGKERITLEEATPQQLVDALTEAKLREQPGTLPRVTTMAVREMPIGQVKEQVGNRKLEIFRTIYKEKKVQVPTKPAQPKTTVKLSATGGPSFESNANTSPSNPVSDSIHSIAPGMTVTVPIGDDNLVFGAGSSFVRYSELTGSSNDSLKASVAYEKLLKTSFLSEAKGKAGPSTTELLVFGANSLGVYSANFEDWRAGFNTLSADWSLSNVPLSQRLCPSGKNQVYCLTIKYALGVAHTWSDNETLNNAALSGGISIGWKPPIENVSLSSSISLRGKHFTDNSIDRDDATFSVSQSLTWQPTSEVAVISAVGYTTQESTIDAAEWDGFSASARVSINLNPCPDKKK